MKRQRIFLTVLVVAVIGLALSIFFLSQREPGYPAEVVSVSLTGSGQNAALVLCAPNGGPLVDGEAAPSRASVQIDASTELLDQRKRSPARFLPEALKPGSKIRLWTTGSMALSEPPQMVATRISLIADPLAGQASSCMP
ncbi:MAG: hypothetical protein SH847_16050 [Roseiflexaceae bacterium]|nr:hypothetical protein [Roseiflexaceae bacterium]